MKIEWRASFPLALRGAQDAIDGLNTQRSHTHGLVGAAAFWLCAADEQLRALSPDPLRYDEVRDRTRGRCLPGLRLARNGLTHGAAVAVTSTGLEWPLVWPLTWGIDVWHDLDGLLGSWVGEPRHTRDLDRQKECYTAYVARRELTLPLEDAASWLTHLDVAGYDVDEAERLSALG